MYLNRVLATGELPSDISVSAFSVYMKTTTGRWLGWGNTYYGELGYKQTTYKQYIPLEISLPVKTKAFRIVSFGGYYSSSSLLYTSMVLWTDGCEYCSTSQTYTWGATTNTLPTLVTGALAGEYVVDIQAGWGTPLYSTANKGYFMALTKSGKLYAWGNNVKGNLGDGTTVDKSAPVEISGNKFIYKISCHYTNCTIFTSYY